MLMVAVALIGSLSILPALLAQARHRVDKGRIPFLGRRTRRRVARLGLRARPRPAPAGARGGALRRRAARRSPLPGADAAHAAAELHRPAASRCRSCRPTTGSSAAFPGAQTPAKVVVAADDVTRPQVQQAIARAEAARARDAVRCSSPISTAGEPGRRRSRRVSIPLAGDGSDGASRRRRCRRCASDVIPATLGTRARRRGGRDRRDRGHARLQRADEVRTRRSCSRSCSALALPAAAGHVPLDRDPDQGGAAQPALGRRRLRPARARLPAPLGGGHARLPLERRDRVVAAAVPVRDPVRALDGLPRVHPQPGQGAASTAACRPSEAVATGHQARRRRR